MTGLVNVERVLLLDLRAALADAGIPAYQVIPEKPPARFVRIERVGGSLVNSVTDQALISIHCYASDPGVAGDLANQVRSLAFNRWRGRWVGDVLVRHWREISGPVFYPDPSTSNYRYQMTGEAFVSVTTSN